MFKNWFNNHMGMHTHYPKGTTVYIQKKDGTILSGKFLDHKSGSIILDIGKINIDEIRAMSPRRLDSPHFQKS